MIASLPMYDRPENAGAHDRFWRLIQEALGFGPPTLTRRADFSALWADWTDPDLLLSQTCGLPFRHSLYHHVTVVGTLDHDLPGCPPGYYTSVLIIRKADTRTSLSEFDGVPFARNQILSQSGWSAAEQAALAAGIRIGAVLETGSHAASIRAVASGNAGWAAIDAQTWRQLLRYEPALTSKLRELGRTRPTPGLPLITARHRDPEPLFKAVDQAAARLNTSDRAALMVTGVVRIGTEAYLAEPLPTGLAAV